MVSTLAAGNETQQLALPTAHFARGEQLCCDSKLWCQFVFFFTHISVNTPETALCTWLHNSVRSVHQELREINKDRKTVQCVKHICYVKVQNTNLYT